MIETKLDDAKKENANNAIINEVSQSVDSKLGGRKNNASKIVAKDSDKDSGVAKKSANKIPKDIKPDSSTKNILEDNKVSKNKKIDESRIVKASVMFHGKPYIAEIYAKALKGCNADLACAKLRIKNGKYAIVLEKLIKSCIANAGQKGLNKSSMFIHTMSTGRGKYLKRREFKGRGRTGVISIPYAYVALSLIEKGVINGA